MFYHVRGELSLLQPFIAVVDCGGVGYKLTISLNTSDKLRGKEGREVKLFTHLQTREDGVELFGFHNQDELELFKLLTSVSGVGPKAGMSILSTMTPDKINFAICTEDVKSISKAPGIGAKTAARIILELKDKMQKTVFTKDTAQATAERAFAPSSASSSKLTEATDALTFLGYSKNEVLDALKGMDIANMELEAIITAALRRFAK